MTCNVDMWRISSHPYIIIEQQVLDIVDGRNLANHLGSQKTPVNDEDKLPTSTGDRRISSIGPSTVWQQYSLI